MECSHAQHLINARLDGELPAEPTAPAERAELDLHLASCPVCAEQLAAMRELDGELRMGFAGQRVRATQFADRMAQRFLMRETPANEVASRASTVAEPAPVPAPASVDIWRLASWLVAMAAGFLLAVLIFKPWQQGTLAVPEPEKNRDHDSVARLVVATGDVSVRTSPHAAWTSFPALSAFTCPSGASVRTEPGVRCELQTANGSVVRMNDNSQVTVVSPSQLELDRGQVWCFAPEDKPMVVSSPAPAPAPATVEPTSWSFGCRTHASLVSSVDEKGQVRLTAARGPVEVHSGGSRQNVPPGKTVTLAGGAFAEVPHHEDALLAAKWIDSLLIRKSPADPELLARVDSLLAQIGEAKASYLYERELRALGEHCVLPLLRYVQSPLSADATSQRRKAMRIACDLAPSWAVGELIPLLADRDGDVRFEAASTLRRLTGESQGREPADWRSPWENCTPTFTAWQSWWKDNEQRYPAPEFAKVIGLPGTPTKKG